MLVTITTITTVRQVQRNYKHDVGFQLIKMRIFINTNTTFTLIKRTEGGTSLEWSAYMAKTRLFAIYTDRRQWKRKNCRTAGEFKTSALRSIN